MHKSVQNNSIKGGTEEALYATLEISILGST